MKPRKLAVFWAGAFPDDCVENDGEIVVFPGRNIAEALIPFLEQSGCTKIEAPSHEHEHGWHIYFRSGGKAFFLQVSRIEPETILLFGKIDLIDRLFRLGSSQLAQLLTTLRPLMGADPRFQGLAWFTQEEMDTVDWWTPLRALRDKAMGNP